MLSSESFGHMSDLESHSVHQEVAGTRITIRVAPPNASVLHKGIARQYLQSTVPTPAREACNWAGAFWGPGKQGSRWSEPISCVSTTIQCLVEPVKVQLPDLEVM